MTPEQFEAHMHSDSLQLPVSVGAFEAGRLVGFILHGTTRRRNQQVIYNGGTGVLPIFFNMVGFTQFLAMYEMVLQPGS